MNESVDQYEPGHTVQIGVETGPPTMSLYCHISDETQLRYEAYPDTGLLIFEIGTDQVELSLDLQGEVIDRFIIALIAARNHLLEEHLKLHNGPDGPIDLYPADNN